MKRLYILTVRATIQPKAMFFNVAEGYVTPLEPSPYSIVKLKFRTVKNNVDYVFLCIYGERVLMEKVETKGVFDYYETEIELDNQPVRFHFYIESGRTHVFYDRRGAVRSEEEFFEFRLIPGFRVPDWAKGCIMYQIYTDRFRNGDPTNDVLDKEYYYINGHTKKAENWDELPYNMDVGHFYGGDLAGVMEKLPYLKDLGIECIYFNPLFVSPSNHRYDIQDYDYIDPHIGKIVSDEGELLSGDDIDNKHATRYINRVTNKANLEASNRLFAELVAKCHSMGIRVIIDGVFNHCGSFNKWLDKERIYEGQEGYENGAYISKDSPYHSFFKFHNDSDTEWPYNHTYDGWWGHDTLPKLNYEQSAKLQDYILRIAAKWVSPPYNCDGWRLDVAADLGHSADFNHEFWKKFRRTVKQANPDAIILAEHYGEPTAWLQGDEWDSVMNYDAFMEPITWFLTGEEKHSDDFRSNMLGNTDAFWGAMDHAYMFFSEPSIVMAMNELSNHDHSRFLTRTNHMAGRASNLGHEAASRNVDKSVFREAILIQFTWPGNPTIYYGDEAGVVGFTDPDNRRTYPWGHEDTELINYHKDIIQIHKTYRELRTGSVMKLVSDYGFLSYARFTMKSVSIIAVNNTDHNVDKALSVWETGLPRSCQVKRVMETYQTGYTTGIKYVDVVAGRLHVELGPHSGVILHGEIPY
ncbi:MAG: glycoside hydrolase family 13 protein [Lachnospiraceae bacterium]|nr:glycoside hydrolase family 13 protein [Lachnospiraceae bacterium]